ncbi:MAG TPA: polysaccharide biosynthesis protein [Candidatus Cloacimonas sp.]|nr:polysaccharide biosynthesis protein [Candidatus Cloacimonas sp.]
MDNNLLSNALKGKKVLVTGGTGSFGRQVVREILSFHPAYVCIFSRDEKKQYEMALTYRFDKSLRFIIGDVRDLKRTRDAMHGIDIVFHAAALKQVPSCEYAPLEAVETNIIGADNVRRSAIEAGVKIVIAISTDKAVKPVNVMGMTKAIQERIMLDPSYTNGKTKFICVRYGNVLGSRGSVIPLFFDYIGKGMAIPITNPYMTRFQLTLKEAVNLVLRAVASGKSGNIWVQKMPAAKVTNLAQALAYGITGKRNYPMTIIGTRPGEKIHEVLVSEEEMWRATETKRYFIIHPWTESNKKQKHVNLKMSEYSSATTHQLSQEEIYKMLESDGWFRSDAKAKAKHGIEILED